MIGRRDLLGALALGVPLVVADAPKADAPADAPPRADPPSPADGPCLFFTPAELRLVEALIDRLVPSDALGAGAKDAGVARFIDRQLAGPWGAGNHFYAQGPFRTGTPQQGYQLSFTPAQLFRAALPLIDKHVTDTAGEKHLADLDGAKQDAIIAGLQRGEIDLSPVPSAVFFAALLDVTMEGFFSDPTYGGNKGLVGWKLVGFPGCYDSFTDAIEQWGMPWLHPPLSIADAPAMKMSGAAALEHPVLCGGGK
jgi:gluconate 2-dehydrogenase gamma chain